MPSRALAVLASEEQKQRWLPGCANGDYSFAIGISEPGAGSGMTDMITSATPDGDHIVLNGQKAYCTGGHLASHIFVFARWGKTQGPRGIGALVVERGFALGGGTTEILRNTIAAMVYGRAFDQRRG